MRRVFNSRWFSDLGYSRPALEYLRQNDADTTSVQVQIDAHEAAADPHPQYTTDAEATVIAASEAAKASTVTTFLLMGA